MSSEPSPLGLNAAGRTSAPASPGATVSMVIFTVLGDALPSGEEAVTTAV